jgi:hypothetical protein
MSLLPEGFRPIKEAPKKAIEVELWHEQWGQVKIGHFAHGDGDGLMPPFGPAYFYKDGPCMRPTYREFYPQPTHFRFITVRDIEEAPNEK